MKSYGLFNKKKPESVKKTRKQIDQEYSNLAMMVGHNLRLIKQMEEQVAKDLETLDQLSQEALKMPPEDPQPSPTPSEDLHEVSQEQTA